MTTYETMEIVETLEICRGSFGVLWIYMDVIFCYAGLFQVFLWY
jgi:hypothetical protein